MDAFARDNQDILESGDFAIGMWKIEDPAKVIARGEEPYMYLGKAAPAATVVLDIVANPSRARGGLHAKVLGMTYRQHAVND